MLSSEYRFINYTLLDAEFQRCKWVSDCSRFWVSGGNFLALQHSYRGRRDDPMLPARPGSVPGRPRPQERRLSYGRGTLR